MLLTGLEPATHRLKADYSSIELQKRMALTVGLEPTEPAVNQPNSFQDCLDTNFGLRQH